MTAEPRGLMIAGVPNRLGKHVSVRYLSSSDVERLLPPVPEQLSIVRAMFDSHLATSQSPPVQPLKPRATGFVQAMPAYVEDLDLTMVKWIGGDERNSARELPYLGGLIVINESDTGLPEAILDCGAITTARTAAVSGVCIAALAPQPWSRAAIVGYGAQARAHVAVLTYLNPHAQVAVATSARSQKLAVADGLVVHDTPRDAIAGADVVITGIPLTSRLDPSVDAAWITDRALVLPLDDDASLSSSVVDAANRFVVDDPLRYELDRAQGLFAGWRVADGSVADALAASGLDRETQRPSSGDRGLTVCMNQGLGAMDAPLAAAVLREAKRERAGVLLPR